MPDISEIPEVFAREIERGRSTLFLGAGASAAAGGLTGDQLSSGMARAVLGVEWDLPLDRCVSLAGAQNQLTEARRFIVNNVSKLLPSPAHLALPSYPWRAIVTTNYDQIVELAFEQSGVPQLVTITDADQLGDLKSTELPFLKLHGTCLNPAKMVSSTEDLYDLRRTRQPMVSYVEALHCMGPVIYVGYSFRDTHIIDLVYDLTRRFGASRQPILFVGQETDFQRARLEKEWFDRELRVDYLPIGFDRFMLQVAKALNSFNLASRLAEPLAPCRIEVFKFKADASITWKESGGYVECWLTYKIHDPKGFAGFNLVPARGSADLSSYRKLSFELSTEKVERLKPEIEAVNLRDIGSKMYFNLVSLDSIEGRGWCSVTCDLTKFDPVDLKCVDRVALANNGERSKPGQEYKVGLRNLRRER